MTPPGPTQRVDHFGHTSRAPAGCVLGIAGHGEPAGHHHRVGVNDLRREGPHRVVRLGMVGDGLEPIDVFGLLGRTHPARRRQHVVGETERVAVGVGGLPANSGLDGIHRLQGLGEVLVLAMVVADAVVGAGFGSGRPRVQIPNLRQREREVGAPICALARDRAPACCRLNRRTAGTAPHAPRGSGARPGAQPFASSRD